MQTYKYDELDERGKDYVHLYNAQLIEEGINEMREAGTPDNLILEKIFDGVRFNEHGERIA